MARWDTNLHRSSYLNLICFFDVFPLAVARVHDQGICGRGEVILLTPIEINHRMMPNISQSAVWLKTLPSEITMWEWKRDSLPRVINVEHKDCITLNYLGWSEMNAWYFQYQYLSGSDNLTFRRYIRPYPYRESHLQKGVSIVTVIFRLDTTLVPSRIQLRAWRTLAYG